MKLGINAGGYNYYQNLWSSPDLWSTFSAGQMHRSQATLVADHVKDSGVFELNDSTVLSRDNFNGTVVSGTLTIPTTTGRVNVSGYVIAGKPTFYATGFDGTGDRDWPAGTVLDNSGGNGWTNTSTNPANWPLAPMITENGRNTGYPAGLKSGQNVQGQTGSGMNIASVFPTGTLRIIADGTGTISTSIGDAVTGAYKGASS